MKPVSAQFDDVTITWHLRRLAAAYPAFRFSRELFGWKGVRWVAERKDRMASGVGVVITADLAELHAALERDKAGCAR
jgi:hypothetical protein